MNVQETSHNALASLPARRLNALHEQIVTFLRGAGDDGATDEEMQNSLRMPANTQRPRRRELVQHGRVRDSGKRRNTASGTPAIVWVLT